MFKVKFQLAVAALIALVWVQTGFAAAPEKHPGMGALARAAAEGDAVREVRYLELLNKAVYQQSIIDAITRPAEGKAWKEYRPIFLTEERINAGVQFWQQHEVALRAAEQKYKVSAAYIVAIIGVETFYGRNAGKYRVLDALTTLAFYYPKRGEFFAGELRQFLKFDQAQQIRIDPETTLGSYAGAMGLGQFIPTSYMNYAADGDADGMIDLFKNREDAIASVARYFNLHGWEYGKPVALSALAPIGVVPKDLGVLPVTTLAALSKQGYQFSTKLKGTRKASLQVLEGAAGTETHVSLHNFYVITRYNRSPLYAMAVNQLAAKLRTAKTAATPVSRP